MTVEARLISVLLAERSTVTFFKAACVGGLYNFNHIISETHKERPYMERKKSIHL